ncbi:MAG: hypothetical protein ACFFCM_15825, partial [Promethearchaeota archaeon]
IKLVYPNELLLVVRSKITSSGISIFNLFFWSPLSYRDFLYVRCVRTSRPRPLHIRYFCEEIIFYRVRNENGWFHWPMTDHE